MGAIELQHIAVRTPQVEDHAHCFRVHCCNFDLDDRKIGLVLQDSTMAAFSEDPSLIEPQHLVVRRGHHTQGKTIAADRALIPVRFRAGPEAR